MLKPPYSAGVHITLHRQPAAMNRTNICNTSMPAPTPASPHHPPCCAYQETSLTKWSFSAMPAPASKVEEWLSPLKSQETTCNRGEILMLTATYSLNHKCRTRTPARLLPPRK